VPDDELTIGATVESSHASTSRGRATPTKAGRFEPGSIVAGRYRLVALLGRGGMGEVYRADDLTLDQPVALKFLPEGVAADPDRLAQFHQELRVARQVSHKNVCRLYDLGDADGRRFLTMEYVDGEDLASLLRRIGRIPGDKAVAIARQLCAGLGAAHERGVIHGDLKPANVMLDGEGNVRITDFGLAAAIDDPGTVRAGTPQYMAPEQLAGQPGSVRSDIYALGLVLFEIFTGRRAHDAKTIDELKRFHESGTVTTPSSVVRDLDPSVERAILRCLERDPQQRPGSALAVAAALPGGDPLAAALAAGETPSPEMLVAAGEREAMPVGRALALVGAFAVALVIFVALAPRSTVAGLVPLDKPPAVLADRAQQILSSLGYAGKPADSAFSFDVPPDYIHWIEQNDRSPHRWDVLQSGTPPALMFWYRTSPRDLVPVRVIGAVTPSDPPESISGMQTVVVDTAGRLQEFHAVPPQFDPEPAAATEPAWKALFDAAGLEMSKFSAVAPQWTPRNFADSRAAWEGPLAERPDIRVRVEAAAYRERPVSFYVVGPWSRPSRMVPLSRTALQSFLTELAFAVWVTLLVGALVLARNNLRANRADRRSATTLATWVIATFLVNWAFGSHHVADFRTDVNRLALAVAFSFYQAGTLWVMYLAIEPYARRLWPDGLLGWTRLLSGRVRDARVGRDVLIGCVAGSAIFLVELGRALIPPLLGRPAPAPEFGESTSMLAGTGRTVAQVLNWTFSPIQSALFFALLFVALRFLLRRNWAATVGSLLVLLVIGDNGAAISGGIGLATIFYLIVDALIILLVFRAGLLATTVALIVDAAITTVPIPTHLFEWSGSAALWTIAAVFGLVCFGFYAARAGSPVFEFEELKI
jgi:serine/threonine-protein kinase